MASTFYTSPYGTRINTTGLTGAPLQKIQTLANSAHGLAAQQYAQKQRGLLIPQVPPPPAAQPPPAATPTQPVVNSSPIANAQPPQAPAPNAATTAAEFPNERIFEPQNFQGSPLYQFQVKSGEDQLAKSLAAKGLTGSGEAIRQELNIPLQAAAQDTDRMTRLAEDNANRLQTYQQNEADRLERAGNNQWDRGFSLAQLMSQQSPFNQAFAGLNTSAGLTQDAAKAQANYLASAYNKIFASSPGRAGTPFNPLQVPSGPDYTNILPAQIAGNQSSNNGWLNLLTQGLGSLF